MTLSFLKSRSLQTKFILITLIAVIILMVILGIMITTREHSIMHREIERQGRILAETLAIPVMNDLIYEKLGLVEEGGLIDNYVTEIFGKKDIDLLYMAVLDADGRIISHNDFNEYGKVYDDPVTVEALRSDSTVVQTFYDGTRDMMPLTLPHRSRLGKRGGGHLSLQYHLRAWTVKYGLLLLM